jgi:hypothetical protein
LPAHGCASDTVAPPATRGAATGPPTTCVAAALGCHFMQQVPLARHRSSRSSLTLGTPPPPFDLWDFFKEKVLDSSELEGR